MLKLCGVSYLFIVVPENVRWRFRGKLHFTRQVNRGPQIDVNIGTANDQSGRVCK